MSLCLSLWHSSLSSPFIYPLSFLGFLFFVFVCVCVLVFSFPLTLLSILSIHLSSFLPPFFLRFVFSSSHWRSSLFSPSIYPPSFRFFMFCFFLLHTHCYLNLPSKSTLAAQDNNKKSQFSSPSIYPLPSAFFISCFPSSHALLPKDPKQSYTRSPRQQQQQQQKQQENHSSHECMG